MSNKEHKKSFEEVLANVREAIRIISDPTICAGFCYNWKYEGPHSYTESASVVDGKCSKCHRIRYKKQ